MEIPDLKEPISPQLSSEFLLLLKKEAASNNRTTVTYPQTTVTPWENRTVPSAVSEDSKRIQTRVPKLVESQGSRQSKNVLSTIFKNYNTPVVIKRPTNFNLEALRVPIAEADVESDHSLNSDAADKDAKVNCINKSNKINSCSQNTNATPLREVERVANVFNPPSSQPLRSDHVAGNFRDAFCTPQQVLSGCSKLKNEIPSTSKRQTNSEVRQSSHEPIIKAPVADVIYINERKYKLMKILGEGGSSKVFEAYDEERKLVAIKCVKLTSADDRSRESYINEVTVLKRLQHSDRIIKLYDYEYKEPGKTLLVALEKGETDLATFLKSRSLQSEITSEMIKFYWSEMLRAVEIIHNEGIIHSDLKPQNFLFVKGKLKLIDFGISSFIPSDVTSIVKNTKVGSIGYISPEALMDVQDENEMNAKVDEPRVKIGVKSDVWSLGCILFHMVYGRTPFSHIKDMGKIMLAIMNPNHAIAYPPLKDTLLLDVMQKCIVRQPKQRLSIKELLEHPYLTGEANKCCDSLIAKLLVELSPKTSEKVTKAIEKVKFRKT